MFIVKPLCTNKMNVKGGRGREERGHRKALDLFYFFKAKIVPLTLYSIKKDDVLTEFVAE